MSVKSSEVPGCAEAHGRRGIMPGAAAAAFGFNK
jgi:hypothetical protein